MLPNAHFLAKFRFDTAENEPAKILLKFCEEVRLKVIEVRCNIGMGSAHGSRGELSNLASAAP